MPSDLPLVSVLVPTLNAARTLPLALASLREQDWPADRLELIVADAGSTDATREIAQQFGAAKILENPLRTGEAGKSVAAAAATGELLLLLDSDNVLPDAQWLRRMVAPFLADASVIASEPLQYTSRAEDPAMVRYFAQLGMNDPFCLWLGTYDRECAITNRWTELDVPCEEHADWRTLTLRADAAFPTIGANGFLIRCTAALRAPRATAPYWFDVDVLREIAAADGAVRVAKVHTGIVHLYCADWAGFKRKQSRRVRDYIHFREARASAAANAAPRPAAITPHLSRAILRFSLACITIIPLWLQARRAAARTGDREAWRCHIRACRITWWIYATTMLRRILTGRVQAADRNAWRQ